MSLRTAICLIGVSLASASAAQDLTGDPALGAEEFSRCVACHVVVDGNGEMLAGRNAQTGPNLYGVAGRLAGSVEGFRYGNGIEKANAMGLSWTEENFVGYVQDPTGWLRKATEDNRVRGKMGYRLRDEDVAADVYAYLASVVDLGN
ncbi:MAG: c-type cytochrome [Pseudomonadota bacterium]